jgi:hypothetical protein
MRETGEEPTVDRLERNTNSGEKPGLDYVSIIIVNLNSNPMGLSLGVSRENRSPTEEPYAEAKQ